MRTRSYIRLFAALALMTLSAAYAEVYKWKDEQGRVQFGDRPPVSAEKVPIRSFSAPAETTTESGAPTAAGVIMYSTTWCGVCKQARQYMVSKGIPFTEVDVEKSDAGRDAYKKLNGRGVPIIMVGDKRMNGFSAGRLEQLLQASRSQ